jgi:hypothetical protein
MNQKKKKRERGIGGENEEYIMQLSRKVEATGIIISAAPLSITSSKTGSAFSYSL